jgi:predicted nucleic acid-binding protein
MKLVLDTSAYSLLARRHPGAGGALREARQILLPTICLGELHAGFRKGARHAANVRFLGEFVAAYEVGLIEIDPHVAEHYGAVHDELRRAGTPIPTNDLWIAAACLSVEGTLLTADRHFSAVPNLQLRTLDPV